MKTIIKIVIALVVLTAVAQTGMVAVTNYQFEDAVHEAMLFDPRASDQELTETILSLARNSDIPLEPDGISIRQVGADLHVNITYDAEIPLIPGIYSRPWTFNPSSTIRLMPGTRGSPKR